MTKEKLIVICGPTGVGKTALSLDLAQKFSGEVVNGDSMQVYRHLDIGTAKISPEECGTIPHHLFDLREVHESYSVADFKRDATEIITNIHERGHLPLLVGGTGLYLEALLYDFDLGAEVAEHPAFREAMADYADQYGPLALHQKLQAVDPEAAEAIHPNNQRRVIRALEVCQFSSGKFSDQKQSRHQDSPYDLLIIALVRDRQKLYAQINQRVLEMVDQGLLEEARWLYQQDLPSDAQSMKAIAYKELFPYLSGQERLEAGIQRLQKNTRHYAKRQLTWIRHRLPAAQTYDLVDDPQATDYRRLVEEVKRFLKT
ncbi:tRNA (adenosine(37)-N6)-dimethylallyltransferase MiaA [Aerococcus sanguinicola]|uniref:tRNA (adenosine(37)-N6)-dimethylallyltransferase MiaA n=1 Tax=unclassified Aerococcus TaxID=2618060 RepID=UPI0008A45FCB|nr:MULTISPECIES: tRNA (adenosine(37)-N6)-dimethylallyltransferase MiaA [unclassified Aerococcus]MDK6232756.1 tRNA (adenosine(37)-N6)-dimethylallyltransferase MiaA [Aerococcus sp. UMB10185]MDK6854954.1 tRNA (adenosine(37)-N6)-dimethylallyltransferase MiaA [Aerococcus sp. UMB7533]MDK8501780.1 tRNA (adenosine(37)-N6)-dimethylallyltransferase MiaA [Aerococcus sp. UMB1112A]OFN02712.1 tRNA dimethylallyltransferase [Aerococcus sp. HMSC062A02]OHO45619.1 tRNA dimethylallyltransferase [Aerococcus sp. HM